MPTPKLKPKIEKIHEKPVEPEETPIQNFIARTIIIFIFEVIGFRIIANANIGLTVTSWESVILAVILLAVINALIWPIMVRFFLPFIVFTVGIGTITLNGILLYAIGLLLPDLTIEGLAMYLTPFVLSLISTIISAILTSDSESSYYRTVIRDLIKTRTKNVKKYTGLIIVEIDGLAYEILEEAMLKGYMPTLSKWIHNDTHAVDEWETDLSSQTGASQAGILHGNNENITAFRWVEKENNNKIVSSTNFADSEMIEKRISNGNGLLSENGMSICNLFTGDTDNVVLTCSTVIGLRKLYNKALYFVFSSPNRVPSIVLLFIWDIILEIYSQIKHFILNIRPRIRRGPIYIFTRACSNVILREITTETLIGSILLGDIDVAYATYMGYDEIAHHSGTRDEDAFKCLKQIDKQIKRLEEANSYSNRNYEFVIQSDHGQCNGETFRHKYKISFENYVRSLLPENMAIYSNMNTDEYYSLMFKPWMKRKESILDYINTKKIEISKVQNVKKSEVIVLASGNLSMIYLTQFNYQLKFEEIKEIFPNLIPGLVKHEGIGFIVVKSNEYGVMVIGEEGINYIEKDTVEGEDPLKNYGKNAKKHILRHSKFKYNPDILVNAYYNPKTGETYSFEELTGSHGGLGGLQTKPFILHPKDWEMPDEIVGSEEIYKILKNKLYEYKNLN